MLNNSFLAKLAIDRRCRVISLWNELFNYNVVEKEINNTNSLLMYLFTFMLNFCKYICGKSGSWINYNFHKRRRIYFLRMNLLLNLSEMFWQLYYKYLFLITMKNHKNVTGTLERCSWNGCENSEWKWFYWNNFQQFCMNSTIYRSWAP